MRRIETSRAGELVHVDIKKQAKIPKGGGWRVNGVRAKNHKNGKAGRPRLGYAYVHSAIDAHSRLAYSEIHANEQATTAVAFWRRARAFAAYGITIERVMTDNGACYRSRAFADELVAAAIVRTRIKPYCPQTMGRSSASRVDGGVHARPPLVRRKFLPTYKWAVRDPKPDTTRSEHPKIGRSGPSGSHFSTPPQSKRPTTDKDTESRASNWNRIVPLYAKPRHCGGGDSQAARVARGAGFVTSFLYCYPECCDQRRFELIARFACRCSSDPLLYWLRAFKQIRRRAAAGECPPDRSDLIGARDASLSSTVPCPAGCHLNVSEHERQPWTALQKRTIESSSSVSTPTRRSTSPWPKTH